MYVKDEVITTTIIEKSEFICYLNYCKDEESFRRYLQDIRKKHYDATHACFAFITKDAIRSSDDGEPAGTAGVPILNILQKNELENSCAIVVRYFGGIKLGAGGLIRAYGGAVSNALRNATLAEDVAYPKYEISLGYDIAPKLDYFLRTKAILLDCSYEEEVTFTFLSLDDKICDKVMEYTKGVAPKLIGEEIMEKVL